MRRIGWLLLILLALGWLASEVPLGGTRASSQCETVWRRTRDGWEHRDRLTVSQPTRKPALHPAVVATLQGLLSLWGLVAFSAAKDRPA